jgi:hypothetical protein
MDGENEKVRREGKRRARRKIWGEKENIGREGKCRERKKI